MEKSKNSRIRHTIDEIKRNTFFQMPKFLFEDEFKSLSNDARVLYSLLRDRHDLSVKNGWVNADNEVYLNFSRDSMCDLLGLSKKTVIKAMDDLKKHRLVDEQRMGQGKPNRIYLLTIESLDFTKTCNFYTSSSGDSTRLKVENFHPNDTELKEIYINETESQGQSQSQTDYDMTLTSASTNIISTEKKKPAEVKTNSQTYRKPLDIDEYETYKELIHEQIEYDILFQGQADEEFADSIVEVMLDVILTQNPDVKIGKEQKSRSIVKSVYMKLTGEHIQHVISQYKAQYHQITHKMAYLRTMLYTVYQEIELWVVNQVRADGMVR
jgi:uncharacterized protein with HEPN domain